MISMRSGVLGLALVASSILSGCGDDKPPPNPVPTPIDAALCGAVSGVVRFEGTPPARKAVSMSEPNCKREAANVLKGEILDSRLIVTPEAGGNGFVVQDAFVWISKGLEGRIFARPEMSVILDQRGCIFTPHVLGVFAWQELTIRNSDPLAHNTSNAVSKANKRFNVTLGSAGSTESRRFGSPEIGMRLACDVHPWMDAYLHVVSNPYFFVTGADGRFALGGKTGAFTLPVGSYVLSVWTQTLGTVEVPITVAAGQVTEVAIPAFKLTKE